MTRPRAAEEKPALRAADIAEVRLHHLHPRERAAFRRTITARALARYEARRAEITFTNAVLEGSTFTLPEVRTLLDGLTPEGKKTTEVLEVSNLARTVNLLHDDVAAGTFALDTAHLRRYNAALMQGLLLEPGIVRGTGGIHGAPEGIAVNVTGRGSVKVAIARPGSSKHFPARHDPHSPADLGPPPHPRRADPQRPRTFETSGTT